MRKKRCRSHIAKILIPRLSGDVPQIDIEQ